MSLKDRYRPLLESVAFAARAHRHQLRKDRETPYVSHPFRVCLIVRHVFGVTDERALMAAVLHDTVEDTNTDYDDLEEAFPPEVADWAARLSKDKRLPCDVREKAYREQLAAAPPLVKVCKLADIFDNLCDAGALGPDHLRRTIERSKSYLEALRPNLPEEARRPFEIVSELLREVEGGWV